ncbi:MAG: hypothetical protein MJZ81_07290 [Bacteroidales bacterium]|nr:hypothetical protein [Bacteroidales bacterium]
MSNSTYWSRSMHLKINGGGISVDTKNIDMKFTVVYKNQADFAEINASVTGLKRTNVDAFAECTNQFYDAIVQKKIHVELSAGYEKDSFLIFDGYVTQAGVSGPPQRTVTFSGMEIKPGNLVESKFTVDNKASLQNCISEIDFESQGWKFQNLSHVNLSDKVGAQEFSGNFKSKVRKLQSLAQWDLSFDRDGIVRASDRIVDITKSSGMKIDKDGGLLRVDFEQPNKANITTWMRRLDNIVGKSVDFRSEIYPGATGKYRVLQATYKGDYLGRDWYSMISGMKIQNPKN